MDAELIDAARALDAGHVLEVLKLMGLRHDAPALALRGVAYARMGRYDRARELLAKAARAFGNAAPRQRARCLLADAEVAFATRDLRGVDAALGDARRALTTHGDRVNAAHATCLAARSALLRGSLEEAEALLASLELRRAPAFVVAEVELAWAEAYLQKPASAAARTALARAERAAKLGKISAFLPEITTLRARLSAPTARATTHGSARLVHLPELEALLRDPGQLLIDARELAARSADLRVTLARRPVLFALLRTLAEAWPGSATRADLIRRAFGASRVNESHRARLRVEMARARRALRALAEISATPDGFQLEPQASRQVTLLTHPTESAHESVLALLRDGEAWSSSALAVALGTSQRSAQRALRELESSGEARSVGRARAKRFFRAGPEITTPLLLPPPLDLT